MRSIYPTLMKKIYNLYTVSRSFNTNGVQLGPSGKKKGR